MNIRPGIISALESIVKHYNMIIFTASEQLYADSVLAKIDPMNSYFKFRLYRSNCIKRTYKNGKVYIKDLRVIKNIPLENMILIDNSLLSFAYNLENGIPILPFYNNKNDIEMNNLKNYLLKLSKHQDMIKENEQVFKFKELLYQMSTSDNLDQNNEVGDKLKEVELEPLKDESKSSSISKNFDSKVHKQFKNTINHQEEKVNTLEPETLVKKAATNIAYIRKKSIIQNQLVESMLNVKNFN